MATDPATPPAIPGLAVLGTAGRHGAWESFLAVRTRPGSDEQPVLLWRIAAPWRSHARLRALLPPEAAAVDGIHHDNVLAVSDVFGDMHDPVLVVQWTEGRNLLAVGQACRQVQASIPVALLAHVLAEAARGVEAAQVARARRGRPAPLLVCPESVLLGYDGSVRVACVAALDVLAETQQRLAELLPSRAALVPPEILRHGEGDAKVESYAVAATLYQLLTDALPFAGRSAADVLAAMDRGPPLAPRSINPSIPAALEELCLRGLLADPVRRAGLAELRAGLEAAAAGSGHQGGREPLAALLQLLFPPGMDHARAWCARMRFSARQARAEAAAANARSIAPTMPLLAAYVNPDAPARPEDFESADTDLDLHVPGPDAWQGSGPDAAPSRVKQLPAQPASRETPAGRMEQWLEETRRLNLASGFEDAPTTRKDIPWATLRAELATRTSAATDPGPDDRTPWWRRFVKPRS
ncbi:MAG: hypothetical protein HY904_22335 [Deltaproteobacteria bacterium]|nr:hypothetical protein [Deltaproteobacteria bacterium]